MRSFRNLTFALFLVTLVVGEQRAVLAWGELCYNFNAVYSGNDFWAFCDCATPECDEYLSSGGYCGEFAGECENYCNSEYCGVMEIQCTPPSSSATCYCYPKCASGECNWEC